MGAEGRRNSISTKVTDAEQVRIAAYCAEHGVERSVLLRSVLLREVDLEVNPVNQTVNRCTKPKGNGNGVPSLDGMSGRLEALIEVFVRTKQEEIRHGNLTIERFLDICKRAQERHALQEGAEKC
jgi:hypothetical protein